MPHAFSDISWRDIGTASHILLNIEAPSRRIVLYNERTEMIVRLVTLLLGYVNLISR